MYNTEAQGKSVAIYFEDVVREREREKKQTILGSSQESSSVSDVPVSNCLSLKGSRFV